MSPLVRLGTEGGAKVIDGMVVIPYMMLAIGTAMKLLPWPLAIASFASLPWAMKLVSSTAPPHLPLLGPDDALALVEGRFWTPFSIIVILYCGAHCQRD